MELRSVSPECNSTTKLLQEDSFNELNPTKKKSLSIFGCCDGCSNICKSEKVYLPRYLTIGRPSQAQKFARNVICNQKYSIITFIPLCLFEQFKYFINLCFLVMAISQCIPQLRIGEIYTYWGPLSLVVLITMCREAVDDIRRWKRDREVNSHRYQRLLRHGRINTPSSEIEVGDLIVVEKDQRIPADLLLLRTSEKNGQCFIRTDQLDGETDWKLRHSVSATQNLVNDADLFTLQSQVYAEPPKKDIYSFEGSLQSLDNAVQSEPLSIENTLWANTVLANGEAIGLVLYCGNETRAVMNTSQPRNKIGILDIELNNISKLLILTVILLSFVLVALKGFSGLWVKYWWRFFLVLSYIIPLALRVNLDLGKIVGAFVIMRDKRMPGCIVRTTTIPEDLGRISYLLSDKTGTLTQNEMVFRKLHLGTVSFNNETMDEVANHISNYFLASKDEDKKLRVNTSERVANAVCAIALCHNVTPMSDTKDGNDSNNVVEYQASSPDEVCLVTWTETVGLTLVSRDTNYMKLRTPSGQFLEYEILHIFPFRSDTKRMGIIVKEIATQEIVFYVKGADVVMSKIVCYQDWLDEETGNISREGLRTLVVGKKVLTKEQYADFDGKYYQAKMSIQDRQYKVAQVLETIERDMELLCVTGVEDKLQEDVRPTLEILRNAGIRVWMLTGDKLETAESIARSSRLIPRNQALHVFEPVQGRAATHLQLNAFRKHVDSALIIQGDSLEMCIEFYEQEFVELACQCPAVVVCRCSPTQKAMIVQLLKTHTRKRCAAIGDGGNDVSMIQAADIGIGLEGKEGRQASLASDFSLLQFKHVAPLILVHGRHSYRNTAALSQFIIHRGAIFCVMQAIFSAVFYFVAIPLFPGYLMIGYATVFTMFPVFSLIIDKDVSDNVALTYPELYKELKKGRELTFKTVFVWILISIYQGSIIMYGALYLFEDDFIHVKAITFTALILTELLMVALTIHTWHILMVVAEFLSLSLYILALVVFKNFFDPEFLKTLNFAWKVAVITSISCIPLFILKFIRYKLRPPIYSKLQE